MADGSLYVVGDDQELSAEWLNMLLGDIHTRIRTIEAIKAELDQAIGELTAVGLQRIDAVVSPLIQQAQQDVALVQANLVEISQQIADILAGAVPAASVVESATRVFVTPEQRAEIDQIASLVAALPTKAPSANAVLSGLLSITGAAKLTSSVAPAALAADANDFAPAGLATASRVKVSATAVRSITGLVAADDGRVVLLENVGAYDINLKAESTASAAANRFAFHSDAILPKNGGVVTLVYDAGLARWLLAGGGKIADLQIGDLLETTANPGSRFLRTDRSLYLNSAYPTLRAALGAYQSPMVLRRSGTSSTPRLYFVNGLWVVFRFSGAAWEMASSPDLVAWTVRTMPTASTPGIALCYGAGLYVWSDGDTIKTSPDLMVWTARAFPSGFTNVRTLVRGATRFMAAGDKTSGYGVIYSVDGVVWTLSASAINAIPLCGAYNPTGACWILGCQSGRIYRSTDDCVTWADLGVLVNGNVLGATAGGGNFGLITGSAPWAYISADGQTMAAANPAYAAGIGSGQPGSISFDGAAFVIGHNPGSVLAKSTDFGTWSFQDASGASGTLYNVLRTGSTVNDAYVVATGSGIWSGLDLSTTQFQVPNITGRTSNTSVYIKAL